MPFFDLALNTSNLALSDSQLSDFRTFRLELPGFPTANFRTSGLPGLSDFPDFPTSNLKTLTLNCRMKYIAIVLLFITTVTSAQTVIRQDEKIKQMVDEVSSKNIEATIRKLVTFKSRHTLSDTTSK